MEKVDIAIIGAGIAGTSLATALAGTGQSVALIDKRENPLDTARGDHIQPAMLAVLDSWGVLDALILAGAERRYGTSWFGSNGEKILTVPVLGEKLKHPWFLFLNHEKIGSTLLRRALESGAQYCSGVRSWRVQHDKDAWKLDYTLPDGSTRVLRATLLVGADGSGSLVRKRLAIEEIIHRYRYPIAVLYGRTRTPADRRTLDVHLTKDRMVSVIPRTGGRSKIGFPIDTSELTRLRALSSDDLCEQLRRWSPGIELSEAKFGAIYPPVSLQSRPFVGEGAAVLIGDASHAMHPARSMGMNTCFRVADQLSKLLSPLGVGFKQAEAERAIAEHEATFSAELAPRLAENHEAGMQMDTLHGDEFKSLVAKLKVAAMNPEIRNSMARSAAGIAIK